MELRQPVARAAGPAPPLSEVIFARLPGPWQVWLVAWAAVPLVTIPIVRLASAAWGVPLDPVFESGRLLNMVLWTHGNAVALITAHRVWTGVERARPALARLTSRVPDVRPEFPFQGMGSVLAPVLLGVLLVAPYVRPHLDAYGPRVTAALMPLNLLAAVPATTGLWVAISLFAGLHRLGLCDLSLAAFEEDRSLGLGVFGSLAFTAFVPFAIAVLPVLLFGRMGRADLWAGSAVLVATVPLFFLSLAGLRTQLVAAKRRYVAWARRLTAEALAPLMANPTAGALREQSPELLAAAEVERRVAAIQEWPLDEGILRAVIAISTSVTGIVVARLILSRFGL